MVWGFSRSVFGAVWLDCDQSLSVALEIIRPNLDPFMNLNEMRDGNKYLQDLNPIRKNLTHKDTDDKTLVTVPTGKLKPARTLEDISKARVTRGDI